MLEQASARPLWGPGTDHKALSSAGMPARCPLMLQTAAPCFLLLTSDNGRYCGLAIVAEVGDGITDASHFLDAPTFGTALLLYVRAACFSCRRDRGQPCLAHVGKVCDMLLYASGNTEVSRFDVGADFFDIRRAGTDTRLRHRARHEKE